MCRCHVVNTINTKLYVYRAMEGLLSRVRPRMLLVVLPGKELVATALAPVRFVSEVDALPVVDQRRVRLERGSALGTEEGLDVTVYR